MLAVVVMPPDMAIRESGSISGCGETSAPRHRSVYRPGRFIRTCATSLSVTIALTRPLFFALQEVTLKRPSSQDKLGIMLCDHVDRLSGATKVIVNEVSDSPFNDLSL